MVERLARLVVSSLVLLSRLAAAQDCVDWDAAPMPEPHYIPIQDGTVYDHSTGLMWKQCPEGSGGVGCAMGEPQTFRLEEARWRARDSRFAGYADWRLPTQDELRSLLRRRCHGLGIDSVTFPRTPAGYFWTSDPATYYPDSAWTLDFRRGHLGYGTSRDAFYVRLVRDAGSCSPARPATCLPHAERTLEPHDGREPGMEEESDQLNP
ncbi:DUF1566 domain-containing protein [Thermochromatium tepidum]|uniref:Lcl C-terminal domain-containing protein n=1 Tax=Thermochromatium tepidum TaxID=1050 RepID=UPI001FEA086C|nr:DUF1566 domain-containing protein [Thermochromatium tepidum]